MPQLSKIQARLLIQNLIDDTGAKLWSITALDLMLEGALDELWGEILDAFPWAQSSESSGLTAITPGYIDLSTQLTRYFRLQNVVRNGEQYYPLDPRDVLISNGEVISAPDGHFLILGNQLHLFPYSISPDELVYVRYSARPEPFTSLVPGPDPDEQEDDIVLIEWPEGYHMAYVYETASRMMEKGDREESKRLKIRADETLYRLKAFLRKQTPYPIMPYLADSAMDYGG